MISASFVGCTSPYAVYFRTPKLAERFIKLHHDELRSYFETQPIDLSEAPSTVFVGFIGALQSSGKWFRAKVVDVEK